MWLKLSASWVNMDNIVRIEFTDEKNSRFATMYSVKPGGSDKTVYGPDDAFLIQQFLIQSQTPKN